MPTVVVPPLSELGFSKFKTKAWREHQQESVDAALNATTKFTLVQAPTGFGKSPFAMATAKLTEPKRDRSYRGQLLDPQSAVLTATKQLQSQYLGDFSDYAKEVKGRGNFQCLVEPVSASNARCTIHKPEDCESYSTCPYYAQRKAAMEAPLSIHSYAYALNTMNYARTFNDQSLLILDEGHLIDDMLMGFVTCEVSWRTCQTFDIRTPPSKTGWEWRDWKGWAEAYIEDLGRELSGLRGPATVNPATRTKYRAGNSLLKTMELLTQSEVPWVVVPTQAGWEFMPTWIDTLADQMLYRHGNKVLIMSATILDYQLFCYTVGIPPKDATFIDVPSSFPVGSKPVYFDPAMDVKAGVDLTPLVDKVVEVIRAHSADKGLVHCVSYAVADAIYNGAPPDIRARLMRHGTADRLAVYEDFRARLDDPVLLSPSMKEGVSLEDEMCRFIIVAKMPFPYLGSPQIKSRMSTTLGKKWYPWKTMCDLIQMTGRGMRSQDDYCSVYILDGNFRRLFQQMRYCLPKYWVDDIRDERGLL